MGEVAKTAIKDITSLSNLNCDALSLEYRELMLNTDQKRIYNTIKYLLLHQLEHESATCSCQGDLKPFRMFIINHFISLQLKC